MEAAHSALDASIYRLPNVWPHFINCVVDPQNYGPNWSVFQNIESYVTTEFSVFVADLCCSMQSSVATCSLSYFLDSVATDFDNVVTELWCSLLVLVVTGMYCVVTKFSLSQQTFSFSACQLCRDRVFFFCRDRISLSS